MDYIRDNKDKPFIYKKPFDYTVEIHLTHMCNFFCSGCSHYSNYKLNGYLSTERFKHYLETWSDKFNQLPLEFRLLGGEPTLHRNLVELIELSRKYMPDNNILLFTNGTYLHKHKNLKDVLTKFGLQTHPKWTPYLKYKPLSGDITFEEMVIGIC